MKRALTNNVEKTQLVTNHLRKRLTMVAIKPFAIAIDQRVFHISVFGGTLWKLQAKQIQLNRLNKFLKVIY